MIGCLGLLSDTGFADSATGTTTASAYFSSDIHQTPPPPNLLWGNLFYEVQTRAIFEDSKTFVDLVPTTSPDTIRDAFQQLRQTTELDNAAVEAFVEEHFEAENTETHEPIPSGLPIIEHIDALWPVLTRQPDTEENRWSSRLPLPYAYMVPGGRFNEIYYWDSYFTMLGLLESGLQDQVRDMTNNFAYLVDEYGHIPNGNRSY